MSDNRNPWLSEIDLAKDGHSFGVWTLLLVKLFGRRVAPGFYEWRGKWYFTDKYFDDIPN